MRKRTADLRKLAKRQRWMIWLVAAVLVANVMPHFLLRLPQAGNHFTAIMVVSVVLQIAFYVLGIIGVVLLLTAQGTPPAITVLTAIVMAAPCGNLLVLLLVNRSVTRTLKRAGLHVRLMGVDPMQLERVLNPDLCKNCGYDLTGNVSGRCPECGWFVEPRTSPQP